MVFLFQIPVDKLADTANTVLDIVDAMVERSLGVTLPNQGETSVKKRVSTLAATIVGALTHKVSEWNQQARAHN